MKSRYQSIIQLFHKAIAGGYYLFSLVSLLGFLGSWHWLLDLFDHFRIQYVIILLTGIVYFGWRKSFRCLGMAVILFLVNLWPIARTSFLMESGVVSDDRPALKIISFNVLVSNQRYEDTLSYLKSSNADVICLYEVNANWLVAMEPLRALYPYGAAERGLHGLGISLYSRHPLKSYQIRTLCEGGMPCVIASLPWHGRDIRMIGFHPLPPVNKKFSTILTREFESIASLITANPDIPTLVFGDFNTTPWSSNMQMLLKKSGLDFRTPKPAWTPTWSTKTPYMLPIDHALCTKHLFYKARIIGPDLGSDHLPQELYAHPNY